MRLALHYVLGQSKLQFRCHKPVAGLLLYLFAPHCGRVVF